MSFQLKSQMGSWAILFSILVLVLIGGCGGLGEKVIQESKAIQNYTYFEFDLQESNNIHTIRVELEVFKEHQSNYNARKERRWKTAASVHSRLELPSGEIMEKTNAAQYRADSRSDFGTNFALVTLFEIQPVSGTYRLNLSVEPNNLYDVNSATLMVFKEPLSEE